jgi:hypothetical protein
LDPNLLVGGREVQQIQMNADNIRATLTAATPAAAMVSLSQINEVAALVGTLLGIAFLLWRWRKQWKAGNAKNLD